MEAFDTADAGTSYAYELVRNMRGDFTCLLRGPDGQLKSGDEFTQRPSQVFNTSGVEITPTSKSVSINTISPHRCELRLRGRVKGRGTGRTQREPIV